MSKKNYQIQKQIKTNPVNPDVKNGQIKDKPSIDKTAVVRPAPSKPKSTT